MYHRRFADSRRAIALAALLALALICSGASAETRIQTLYAVGPAYGPQTDWQNTSMIFDEPEGNCDDGIDPQYSWNDVATSEEWLEIRHWDAFNLEPGYVISRVEIDVNGRYDNPSHANQFILRSSGSIDERFDTSPGWPQDTYDCGWRMGENGVGVNVTNARIGSWTADDIANLHVAVRRVDNVDPVEPKRARVNAFRVVVTTTNDAMLDVSPNPLAFGAVAPGSQLDKTFTIRNAGAVPVDINVVPGCSNSAFTILDGAGVNTLDLNEQVVVTVRFVPTSNDPAFCNLELGNELVPFESLTGNPCDAVTIPAGTTISAGDLQYDRKDVTISGGTVTVSGSHTFCRLTLVDNAVLTYPASDVDGLNLTVLTTATVDNTSRITAAGMGYSPGYGPGGGGPGYGGGHGGRGGGTTGGASYGSLTEPTSPGSGGGTSGGCSGGAGGGIIRMTVGGVLTVDGTVSANGNNASWNALCGGGGGAGGSVYLIAERLAGSGAITANGGIAADRGGGGGGRIAIYYDASTFTGTLVAAGGAKLGNGVSGGAGTIFTKRNADVLAELVVSNAGAPVGARTDWGEVGTIAANVHVRAGAVWTGPAAIAVQGQVSVESGAFISADGDGYSPGYGPGGGGPGYGGGHGGRGGGTTGGASYGSLTEPTSPGSGGGTDGGCSGGAGGGIIRMTVGGVLTVDGTVSANGNNASWNALCGGGGGAGGSVYLIAERLAGSGAITANGGIAADRGGGGGGRIAIYYDASTFTGTLVAAGGAKLGNGVSGGAGTIFTKRNADVLAELVVSNAGAPVGARTDWGEVGTIAANVHVSAGAVWTGPAAIAVQGQVSVESGAFISADGDGYSPGYGPGGGGPGCGGGHGGRGGGTTGGASYGSLTEPTSPGSGGGTDGGCSGGAGGGIIRMTVGGVLTVDGTVSANGNNASWNAFCGGGGGAGGSVYLIAERLAGSGAITANGGIADGRGGGGGGRIAICSNGGFAEYDTTGNVTVFGGAGSEAGQTGTKYFCSGYLSDAGDENNGLPRATVLEMNHPNPFNPVTVIGYELHVPTLVRLQIYDLRGRLVRTLVDGQLDAGRYEASWTGIDTHGQRVSSGVYLYQLEAGSYRETKRMALLK